MSSVWGGRRSVADTAQRAQCCAGSPGRGLPGDSCCELARQSVNLTASTPALTTPVAAVSAAGTKAWLSIAQRASHMTAARRRLRRLHGDVKPKRLIAQDVSVARRSTSPVAYRAPAGMCRDCPAGAATNAAQACGRSATRSGLRGGDGGGCSASSVNHQSSSLPHPSPGGGGVCPRHSGSPPGQESLIWKW
jgi:hypothetical protein